MGNVGLIVFSLLSFIVDNNLKSNKLHYVEHDKKPASNINHLQLMVTATYHTDSLADWTEVLVAHARPFNAAFIVNDALRFLTGTTFWCWICWALDVLR